MLFVITSLPLITTLVQMGLVIIVLTCVTDTMKFLLSAFDIVHLSYPAKVCAECYEVRSNVLFSNGKCQSSNLFDFNC